MRESGLRVVGRASSFSFNGKNTRTRDIAQELGLTQIVEGSVRRAGKQLRITVSVTRGSEDFAAPPGSFETGITDHGLIFALQDEVARAVRR